MHRKPGCNCEAVIQPNYRCSFTFSSYSLVGPIIIKIASLHQQRLQDQIFPHAVTCAVESGLAENMPARLRSFAPVRRNRLSRTARGEETLLLQMSMLRSEKERSSCARAQRLLARELYDCMRPMSRSVWSERIPASEHQPSALEVSSSLPPAVLRGTKSTSRPDPTRENPVSG